MSSVTKKRKIIHAEKDSGVAAGAGKRADTKSPIADPRFQLDSDFFYLDDNDGEDQLQGSGPGPSSGIGRQGANGKMPANVLPGPNRKVFKAAEDIPKMLKVSCQDEDADGGSGDDKGEPSGSDDDDCGDGEAAEGLHTGTESGGDDEGTSDGEQRQNGNGSGGEGGGEGEWQDGQKQRAKVVLSKRKLERVNEASERRGIVYISRIPPHMKPHKLRQLLEPFGDLGRVYCAPEDPALRRLRKKKGGNSGKNFTEGWVEFEDKRRAKRAALALNGQPMGGSKRSAYHYDLWTLKYLPKFKWDTLTEEINYQRAVREQRLVAEISAAKRERDFYLSRVDKAKAISAIQERRSKKQQQQTAQQQTEGQAQDAPKRPQDQAAGGGAAAPSDDAAAAAAAGAKARPLERHFGQRRAKADPVSDEKAPVLADDVLGLLGGKKAPRHR